MTTEERLEKLEKELAGAKRRSRVMLIAAAMAVAVVFLLGAGGEAVPKVIQAEKFELVDSTGRGRAALEMTQAGEPGLVLGDEKGKIRTGLIMGEAGRPSLGLFDDNGIPRIILHLDDSGEPTLSLSDENGKVRAGMCLGESGEPGLGLYDQEGKTIWSKP
jgi:hypothetical protein